MARKVEVHLLDDIDGTAADETVRFSISGTNYEIDLNAKHAEELRACLAKFILGGRRVGRGGVTRTLWARTATATARSHRAQNQSPFGLLGTLGRDRVSMILRVLLMGSNAEEQAGTDALAMTRSGIRSRPMGSRLGSVAVQAHARRWRSSEYPHGRPGTDRYAHTSILDRVRPRSSGDRATVS